MDTGASLLASAGDLDASKTVHLLNETGLFEAVPVDGRSVELLVDGTVFDPGGRSSLLVDIVPWLSESLVIAHEIGARDFEKNLHTSYLEERLRRIRLVVCNTIELRSASGVVKPLSRYLFRDDELPTLLVVGNLDGAQLSDCASQLSSFIAPNLRSFEPLLLRLAHRLPQTAPLKDFRPSAEDYSFAIQADVETVQECIAFRKNDDGQKLVLVLPVLAYFAGREIAGEFEPILAKKPVAEWASVLLPHIPEAILSDLIVALDETQDVGLIRRRLHLEFAAFNRGLRALGYPLLGSEAELRRLFSVHLDDLRVYFSDRLRQYFAQSVRDLDKMVSMFDLDLWSLSLLIKVGLKKRKRSTAKMFAFEPSRSSMMN